MDKYDTSGDEPDEATDDDESDDGPSQGTVEVLATDMSVKGCPCCKKAPPASDEGLRSHMQRHVDNGVITEDQLRNFRLRLCLAPDCTRVMWEGKRGVCNGRACQTWKEGPTGRKAFLTAALDDVDAPVVRTGELPGITEVVNTRVAIFRHVPWGANAAYKSCVLSVLNPTLKSKMSAEEEYLATLRYLMFNRCVLIDKGRAGKKRRKWGERANLVKRRCERWLAGEEAALWEEVRAIAEKRAGKLRKPTPKQAHVERLVSEGRYSDACKALTQAGLHGDSKEVRDLLKALHPNRAKITVPDSLPESYVPDSRLVRRALFSFRAGTSGGLAMFRPDFMKEALGHDGTDLLEVLTKVVTRIMARTWLPQQAVWVAGRYSWPGSRRTTGCGP